MRLRHALASAALLLPAALLATTPTGATNSRPLDDAAYDAALDDAARALRLKKRLFTPADIRKAELTRELPLRLPAAPSAKTEPHELYAKAARATLVLAVRGENDESDPVERDTERTLASAKSSHRHLRAKRRTASGGDASAFLIHESGLVVTCLHALPEKTNFVIAACTIDGRVVTVRDVVLADRENDLVFLKIAPTPGLTPLPIHGDIPAGSPVRVMGHPWFRYFHMTEGIVARHSRQDPEEGESDAPRPPRLDITADIAEGSSGAPVIDESGAVVGVAQSYAVETSEDGETVFKHRAAIPSAAILGKITAPE